MSVTHKPKTGPVLTGTEYEAADSHVSTDIPQGGPLTADLLSGGFALLGADDGGTGASITAGDASGDDGGAVEFTGGTAADGNQGASLQGSGGGDGSGGGGVTLAGGKGEAGLPGGDAILRGGRGDNNNDERSHFRAYGGDGAGNAGRVEIQTDNDTGSSGDLLTAQGDGTALWVAPTASQPLDATLTALAAANWAANAVPIGSGADALSQVAFAASTFPARASTGNLVAKTITDFGLSLIDDAAASNARTTLGLGTAAVAATGDFDPAGTGAAAAAASIAKTFLDAKGDLISASADNTPSLVTVGANDTILMADSAAAAGLKWVASQTPSTQAFSDAAAQGTADTYARGDHLHGMPASPAATVTWISIARWGL